MMALMIATALILLRTADEADAIQKMPWGVILMVTGVTVLITMIEKTKGLELITSGIANMATAATIEPDSGIRHRPRIGLQQHFGRRAPGVPADGAQTRGAGWAASTRSTSHGR